MFQVLVLNVLPMDEVRHLLQILDNLCEQHRVAYIPADSLCEQTQFTARVSYGYMFSTHYVSFLAHLALAKLWLHAVLIYRLYIVKVGA
ncbi:hypothetical protein PVK06_047906 [Gossypium arboreum]|uniref:Uncharacterized protein n=1 Tax=Gossypium arboreum TaxID=29729 RepID=A0ABR0MET3_GOSAR|nr:hypothetical protein PVK06_047906 [Gossypium arboreum]